MRDVDRDHLSMPGFVSEKRYVANPPGSAHMSNQDSITPT